MIRAGKLKRAEALQLMLGDRITPRKLALEFEPMVNLLDSNKDEMEFSQVPESQHMSSTFGINDPVIDSEHNPLRRNPILEANNIDVILEWPTVKNPFMSTLLHHESRLLTRCSLVFIVGKQDDK
jgi:hypothetical protein